MTYQQSPIPIHLVITIGDESEIDQISTVSPAPELYELRLDYMQTVTPDQLTANTSVPWIITLRTVAEDGMFSGTSDEWMNIIEPFCTTAMFIDIERSIKQCAPIIQNKGPKVIASAHLSTMPSSAEMHILYNELKSYGDIPKIVVQPTSMQDCNTLLLFAMQAPDPLIISVRGTAYQWMRVLLAAVGSKWMYCSLQQSKVLGQYRYGEMIKLINILNSDP